MVYFSRLDNAIDTITFICVVESNGRNTAVLFDSGNDGYRTLTSINE